MGYKLLVDIPGMAKGEIEHDSTIDPNEKLKVVSGVSVAGLGAFDNGGVYDISDEDVSTYELLTGLKFEGSIASIPGFTLQKDGVTVTGTPEHLDAAPTAVTPPADPDPVDSEADKAPADQEHEGGDTE